MLNQRCPLCPPDSPIYTYQKLINHIAIRHRDGSQEILFKCCYCRVVFSNYKTLRSHVSRQHSPTVSESTTSAPAASEPSVELVTQASEIPAPLLDDLFQRGHDLKLEDELQFKAAKLLITMKEIHNATETVVNDVIKGVNNLVDSFLDILQSQFSGQYGHDSALSIDEIVNFLEKLRGQSLFEGVETEKKLEEYMDKEEGLILPKMVPLLSKQVICGNTTEIRVVECGYIVPFLRSLEKLLNCPEILECVDNPRPVKEGVFTSPLDSYFYRNHPVVQEDPCTLAFGMYTDGVEMTDSCSAKSGEHAITFMYWLLYNIYPELRSTTRAINLLGCIKSKILKKYGYEKMLEDFVEGINKLASESGVTLNIGGVSRKFRGIFLHASGDNPGSANLGGFKESHFANKPCRQCAIDKTHIFEHFREENFVLRTKSEHEVQVQELQDFESNPPSRSSNTPNPSVVYGINHRSALMDISGCDVTKCLPQDLMHDTLEGSLKIDMCLLLDHAVNQKKMSLSVINERIQKFSKHFGVNRPPEIKIEFIQKKRLKLTAAHSWNLAYMLPFVLRKKDFMSGNMISVCDAENLRCFILRLNLLDLQLMETAKIQDVYRIRELTEMHHTLFQKLYPGNEIPKMHFEAHFGKQILMYGPLRQHWCFRFEAKHAYFKRLWKIYRNLKDLPKTLAKCHQRRQCGLMLMSKKSDAGPYLRSTDYCGASIPINVSELKHQHLLERTFPGVANVVRHKVVSIKGVLYRKRSAIITSLKDSSPKFGEVVDILKVNGKIVFLYISLQVEKFMRELNAFKVQPSKSIQIVLAHELPYNHKLPYIKSVGATYVVVPCRSFLDYNVTQL